jgi:hypothetical protein
MKKSEENGPKNAASTMKYYDFSLKTYAGNVVKTL